MIKKYLLVGALIAPFTLVSEVNSFEFPDKPPIGELSSKCKLLHKLHLER